VSKKQTYFARDYYYYYYYYCLLYAEAAKPYNTIKHSKNTVKTTEATEMYKNVIRPRVTAYS